MFMKTLGFHTHGYITYFMDITENTRIWKQTFARSQNSASENHVSSTITSGVRGLPLKLTAAADDVTTTLLMEGNLTQEPKTLRVPFTAGSINSAWNMEISFDHI